MKIKTLDRIKLKLAGGEVKFTIGIDQDWVLTNLTDKWLAYYNTIFSDNLKAEDITSWDITEFIKEEAKPFMHNILNIHKFYRDLEITADAQRVITKLFDEGHEIFIVTDPFTRMSFKSKYDWLREKLPFIPSRNFIFTGNKGAVGLDFLIDDGVHNCESFQGLPLLFDAPYNAECYKFYRVRNWQDIEHTFDCKLDKVLEFYREKKTIHLY